MKSAVLLTVILFGMVGQVVAQNGKGSLSAPVVVFEPGSTYASTRIPALVATARGTLLAFCEARVNNSGDWAEIDLLMRRSNDGGNTWLPAEVIVPRETGKPLGNPTPIVDRDGTIHLLFQRNYATAYYMKSTDDGATWTQPHDITYAFEAFRPEYNWKVIAPGPGHAIQLKNGRLLVPVWICEPDPTIRGGHRPSCIATVYSDDHGATWKRGDIVACNNNDFRNPSETVAIERADGQVMLNIRNESATRRRGISFSKDGSTGWTTPVFDSALYEPICMASLLRIDNKDALVFVNPDSEHHPEAGKATGNKARKNLTARLSLDGGKTWITEKVLEPGNAGYSDLALAPDGTLYCVYETNNEAEGWRYKIVLRKFSRKWLAKGK